VVSLWQKLKVHSGNKLIYPLFNVITTTEREREKEKERERERERFSREMLNWKGHWLNR
jgi:hypothetical protein